MTSQGFISSLTVAKCIQQLQALTADPSMIVKSDNEDILRLAFLPIVYKLQALQLWILYKPVASAIPEILHKTLTIPSKAEPACP